MTLKTGGIYLIKSIYDGQTEEVRITKIEAYTRASSNIHYAFTDGSGEGRMREEFFKDALIKQIE